MYEPGCWIDRILPTPTVEDGHGERHDYSDRLCRCGPPTRIGTEIVGAAQQRSLQALAEAAISCNVVRTCELMEHHLRLTEELTLRSLASELAPA